MVNRSECIIKNQEEYNALLDTLVLDLDLAHKFARTLMMLGVPVKIHELKAYVMTDDPVRLNILNKYRKTHSDG